MKFCMMSYTMWRQGEFDPHAMLDLTCELGLEAVDVVTLSGLEASEWRRMLDDHGLRAACHTFFADLNHPEARGRQAGVDEVRRGLEAAAILGAPCVMVVTPGRAVTPREESRRSYLAGLREVAEEAESAGIVLTVENFPGADSPFVTADDFLEGLRELPGLRLTFDSGNAATGEDPAQSFSRCAQYAVHAHFKDWRLAEPGQGMLGLDGRRYQAALIGEGILDHRAVLRAMHAGGYRGYIDIEYEGNEYTPEVAVRRALEYLQTALAEVEGESRSEAR